MERIAVGQVLLVFFESFEVNSAMNPNLMQIKSASRTLTILSLFSISIAWAAENPNQWPRWRGPHDNGSAQGGTYAVAFSGTSNVLWKASLPGKGCSTPIIWDQRIYLTAPAEGQDAVLAFDWSGKRLWETRVGPEVAGKHQNGSGSNPSPVTDGSGVYVYFKSGHLAALDFGGKLRWKTNLVERYGKDTLYWDHGISPVLTEKDVVIARMHHGESWLAAFDKQTGVMHWKAPRNYETPVEGDHSYASPITVARGGKQEILVLGAQHLTAHDAANGKVLWSCGDFNAKGRSYLPVVASALLEGDTIVVPYGRDKDCTLQAIKLGGSGDVTASHRVWKREDTGSFVPTPAAAQGRIYVVRDRGEVECIDATTGKTIWSDELPKNRASYYSSPTVADGKLYAAREDGVVFVARVERKFELLAENNMGERIIASPVPVANRLLLRGEKHLFCIAAQ